MAALSGLTSVNVTARSVFGNKRIAAGYFVIGDGSSTFPATGLSLTPSMLGLGEIDFIIFESKSITYCYDYANHKVIGYVAAASPGAAVAHVVATNTVIANGEQVRFLAIGYGTQ